MDPNDALALVRWYAMTIIAAQDRGDDVDEIDALALATAVVDLDEWLTKGGFLPRVWQH